MWAAETKPKKKSKKKGEIRATASTLERLLDG
jgi:hypothetical protein